MCNFFTSTASPSDTDYRWRSNTQAIPTIAFQATQVRSTHPIYSRQSLIRPVSRQQPVDAPVVAFPTLPCASAAWCQCYTEKVWLYGDQKMTHDAERSQVPVSFRHEDRTIFVDVAVSLYSRCHTVLNRGPLRFMLCVCTYIRR